MKNRKKQKTAEILLTVFTAVLSAVSAYFLWNRTNFGGALKSAETRRMLFELTVVFLLLFVSFWHPAEKRLSEAVRLTVISLFFWIHQIFTPLSVAGLYLAYLLLFGETALEAVRSAVTGKADDAAVSPGCKMPPAENSAGKTKREYPAFFLRLLEYLLTGAALQIITVCVFSAFGAGGAGFFRIQVLITAAVLLSVRILFRRRFAPVKSCMQELSERLKPVRNIRRDRDGLIISLLMSFIITALLLQAGRINIARDYDSLHYGLRSVFVLDNGRGIYENLGSVNDVYVYPKGFEILTLPLSGLRFDACVPAFSWWMTVLTLLCAAAIVSFHAAGESPLTRNGTGGNAAVKQKHPAGLYAAAVLSAVPGIMNMAASAKTDAVTLTFQLAGILFLLADLSGTEISFPWTGLAAFIFTLTLKPTSFLFSFLPSLAGIGFWSVRRIRERKTFASVKLPGSAAYGRTGETAAGGPVQEKGSVPDVLIRKKHTAAGLLILTVSLFAAIGVTARTVCLAGVPLTTAGVGLWQRFGFTLRYPFNSLSMGDASAKNVLKRLIGLFACPVGEDMDHVYIAWGSLAVPVCGLFCAAGIIGRLRGKKGNRKVLCGTGPENGKIHERKSRGKGRMYKEDLLLLILVLTGLACLYLIGMLWQLDGNYFMLLYALFVICAFISGIQAARVFRILIPVLILSFCMCMVTNWSGALGLSGWKFAHAGFLDRQQEERAAAYDAGRGDIYEVLAENPRNRVFALADQPGCFAYPCNVQSYTDLEGSGGNVAILAHYEDFLDFLDYAQTDYLYVEEAFTASRPRAGDLIRYMKDDGLLRPVAGTGGSILYAYDREK